LGLQKIRVLCEATMLSARRTLAFLSVLTVISLFEGQTLGALAVNSAELEARTSIANAESTVVECYRAVADAERAGANVSELLVVLNEAGLLLSKAKMAYDTGDYGSAVSLANQSQLRLNNFSNEADAFGKDATQARFWDFMLRVVASSVGAASVVFGGFALWFLSKRREQVGGRFK
jgi:hypothetical protein